MLSSLIIMAIRGITLIVRFALTIFIARIMGLEDLGLYGLVVGAAALAPPILGLGLNGILSRRVVDVHLANALPHISTQVAFTAMTYCLILPIALCVNAAIGFLPWPLALWVGLVIFLEHVATDNHNQLVGRRRSTLAAMLLFVRGGVWPVLFMCLAFKFPAFRSIAILMLFWLAGLITQYLVLTGYLVRNGRWRYLKFLRATWLKEQLPKAYKFYLQDIGYAGYQFVDRFIIAHFLGLEATGIYTFFWSIANAVYGLINQGVIAPYFPILTSASRRGNANEFRGTAARLQRETWWSSISIFFVLFAAMPFLLGYLHRPQLEANIWVFWIIMPATVFRIAAEGLSLMLYAASRDLAMTFSALGGLVAAIIFAGFLTPLFGLAGVSYASLATSIALLYLRYSFTRTLLR